MVSRSAASCRVVEMITGTSALSSGAPGSKGWCGRILPSITGRKLPPQATWASSSRCQETFRIAAILPFERPSALSSFSASAVASGRVAWRSVEPDCTAARWNRPLADGVASRVEVFDPPPDWPNTITRPGSPPKRSMLARTHSSEATMSMTPQTPALAKSADAPRSARWL